MGKVFSKCDRWVQGWVGLHQGLALSPFLFVMDRFTDEIREESDYIICR